MIIQFCGYLIDTQFIYNISDVKCSFEGDGSYPHDRYYAIGSFKINFVNERIICISLNSNSTHKTMHTDGYKKDEAEISIKLNNVRNKLIKIWSQNQSSIQKINFDEIS